MISIVIPFWNRNNVIDRCLKSILFELKKDDEIIVVDDGSEENFKSEYLENIKYYKLKNNSGPIAARLCGVENAKNPYIIFLDSDDEFIPGWREITRRAIAENNTKAIFFPIKSTQEFDKINIKTNKDYWAWVGCENRAIDYTPVIHRELARSILKPLRVSEMWMFINIYEHGESSIYYNKSICRVNDDAGNQISKIKVEVKEKSEELESLLYVLKKFKAHKINFRKYAKRHFCAWRRHLLKKIILIKKPILIKYLI